MRPSLEGEKEHAAAGTATAGLDEEVLVSDARGELTPAQMVEQKLMALLWGDPVDLPIASEVEDIRRARH
jgi:hypothetical protein